MFTPENGKKAKRYSRVLNPGWYSSGPGEVPPENEWISYDVDEYWEGVAAMNLESELIHKLSDYEFWQVTLQHMGLSDHAREEFWKTFFAPEAIRGRNEAIYGLSRARRLSEETLVKAARSYWNQMLSDMAR